MRPDVRVGPRRAEVVRRPRLLHAWMIVVGVAGNGRIYRRGGTGERVVLSAKVIRAVYGEVQYTTIVVNVRQRRDELGVSQDGVFQPGRQIARAARPEDDIIAAFQAVHRVARVKHVYARRRIDDVVLEYRFLVID